MFGAADILEGQVLKGYAPHQWKVLGKGCAFYPELFYIYFQFTVNGRH